MGITDTLLGIGKAAPSMLNPQPAAPARGLGAFLGRHRGFIDRLNTFGLTLQDIEDGGNRAATHRQEQEASALQRAQAQQAAMQRQQLNSLAQSLNMSPAERLMFQVSPDRWAQSRAEAERPYTLGNRRLSGNQVIYEAPEEEDALAGFGGIPTGMVRDETGALVWAPGYVEAQGQLGRVRRQTVVENPMPSRARSSGGGSSGGTRSSGRPAAVRPSTNPWDRDY